MPVINMTVIHANGDRVNVTAGPKQQIAFEKSRKKGLGQAFNGQDTYVEDVYWLAWKSEADQVARDGGQPVPLFDSWLDTIDDVEVTDGDEEDGAGPL